MQASHNFFDSLNKAFAAKATQKTLAKGELLLREGEIEHHLYLVESGALRIFYLGEHEEHIIRLGYKGSIMNSLSSFLKSSPSELYVEAIRKTTLKMISKAELEAIIYANSDSQKAYITLLELLITQQVEREIDLLISSPVERLNRVLQRSPHLFQEIPLKHIATYLRMQPETLSRIRNS
jgi:CRP/FNR family transcriptional regulator, anaerobic regulatory protein